MSEERFISTYGRRESEPPTLVTVERPVQWGSEEWWKLQGRDADDDPYSCDFITFRAREWRPSDPNDRDGEWHVLVTLPHEVVEWDGYGVPLFEGDVERREWEEKRRGRRRR